MGLNAIVYRNVENLPAHVRSATVEFDAKTGEPFSRTDEFGLADGLIACDRRLGNISHIAYLRDEAAKLGVPKQGTLLSKILYSGSHSGDHIDLGLMSSLKAEIELLNLRASDDVATFLQSMRELIAASEIERNPIVFI
jgi:hypothetical protein